MHNYQFKHNGMFNKLAQFLELSYTCDSKSNWINAAVTPRILFVRKFLSVIVGNVARDNSARIATHYGLDGPGIESRWEQDFPHPPRPALGPTQLPINRYRAFPGGKAAGAWLWPSTPI